MRPRKFGHGRQSTKRLLGEFRNRQKAKFTGHLAGVQEKTQVGGRHASRDRRRFFLHIVGDEPVVFFGAELSEIPPGPERGSAQKQLVFFRGLAPQRPRRQIEPHRNPLTAGPEQQNGQRGEESAACGEEHQYAQCQRQRGHPIEVDIYRRPLADAQLAFRSSLPFQKPPPGYQPPDQGPHDCIEREQHLVRQEGQRKKHVGIGAQQGGASILDHL